jgi:NADPH:quinone reductase-like Zn-dependent oxidoreductase
MSSNKQTVYRITENKGIDYLKEFQEDIPSVHQHEVLIKIHAVSLNYRDLMIINGSYPMKLKENAIPCSDGKDVCKIKSSFSEFF